MRLPLEQKAAALSSLTGAGDPTLVRLGEQWGVVWREPEAPPAARWRGRLIKAVVLDEAAAAFGVDRATVWWTADCSAARRREIVDVLTAEVLP